MKRHPRAAIVAKTRGEIGMSLVKVNEKYDLSAIEFLQIVTGEMQSMLKYMLREERHPEDPGKPADVQ